MPLKMEDQFDFQIPKEKGLSRHAVKQIKITLSTELESPHGWTDH